MNPTCVKCQALFGMKKMGVNVIETAGNPPLPYRVWRADLLSCPICAAEVLTNYSHEPVAERHEDGFDQAVKIASKEWRYVLHNPEYLATKIVGYGTAYVREYAKQ